MATNPTGATPALVERAKNIILKPREEWPRIDAEPATIGGIYKSYVLILAAIPSVAMVIGQLLFGYLASMQWVLATAILHYLISLGIVYLLALVIDALAPTFGGTKDPVKAFKVAAYSLTAAWVAGIFNILPELARLGLIVAAYSFVLLYFGLPILMKVAAEKAIGYVAVIIIAAIILVIVGGVLEGKIIGAIIGSAFSDPAVTIRYSG